MNHPKLSVSSFRNVTVIIFLSFLVPLGSIPELPAESCKEIKASEGEQAVSGNYWFKFNILNYPVLVHCDMKTEGKA